MDITTILQTAKDTILADGEHMPMLYVECKGSGDIALLVLAGFGGGSGTSLAKQKQLFLIGRLYGLEHKGAEVSQVCFVCEAWASSYSFPVDQAHVAHPSPSKDPNRTEVLTVQVMNADSAKRELACSMYVVEMLRDGKGILVDLLPKSQPMDVSYNKLLTAFMEGVVSAKMSDRELGKFIQNRGE